MAVPVQYSARFDTVDLVERGRTTLLRCRTYRAGTIASPSSGTVSIYDSTNTLVVSAAAATVSDGWATYSLLGSVTSALDPADGWRIEWSLVMPDGNTHSYRNEAALCRCVPSPVVTEAVLYARVPSLDPSHPAAISSRAEYSDLIDEAWVDVTNRLLAGGNRVELVLSPSSLREPHLLLTLSLIYEDMAGRLNPAHMDMARSYREQFEASWKRLDLRRYDTNDDGEPDTRRSARGSIWVM